MWIALPFSVSLSLCLLLLVWFLCLWSNTKNAKKCRIRNKISIPSATDAELAQETLNRIFNNFYYVAATGYWFATPSNDFFYIFRFFYFPFLPIFFFLIFQIFCLLQRVRKMPTHPFFWLFWLSHWKFLWTLLLCFVCAIQDMVISLSFWVVLLFLLGFMHRITLKFSFWLIVFPGKCVKRGNEEKYCQVCCLICSMIV